MYMYSDNCILQFLIINYCFFFFSNSTCTSSHAFVCVISTGNEISRVEGLNGLYHLTELVLDRNKIKMIGEHLLEDLTGLKELHIEENR